MPEKKERKKKRERERQREEREGEGRKGRKEENWGGRGWELITFGARDGGTALGCKAVVMDSVAQGILVFLVDGIATETQMVERKAANNESFIFFLLSLFGASLPGR